MKTIKELFGWRRFHNRREVAGCLGLTPTPYSSGESQVNQGISKAGNKRSRWLMIELAWSWLRYQPTSQLTQWFNARFAPNGKRMRRVGIVALARRLAIALWRYLEYGEVPSGASLACSPCDGRTISYRSLIHCVRSGRCQSGTAPAKAQIAEHLVDLDPHTLGARFTVLRLIPFEDEPYQIASLDLRDVCARRLVERVRTPPQPYSRQPR